MLWCNLQLTMSETLGQTPLLLMASVLGSLMCITQHTGHMSNPKDKAIVVKTISELAATAMATTVSKGVAKDALHYKA